LSEEDLLAMHLTPISLHNNTDANVWNYYLQKFVREVQILPPSLHPKMLANPDFKNVWQFNQGIPLLGHTNLIVDRRRAQEQFSRIITDDGRPISYKNSAQALSLTRLMELYDSSNHTTLSKSQKLMMKYIIERADNHTSITLVRNKKQPAMHSVVATTTILKGTCPLAYGGMHYVGAQMTSSSIGTAASAVTWSVLEHTEESKSVYLHPTDISNYGRFINGVRVEDQRRANLTIIKIKDNSGNVHIYFVATRDILEGEHLLYYYGDSYSGEDFYDVDRLISSIEWELV